MIVQDAAGRDLKVGDSVVVQRRKWTAERGAWVVIMDVVRVERITRRVEQRGTRTRNSTRIYYRQPTERTGRVTGVVTSGERCLKVGPGLGLV